MPPAGVTVAVPLLNPLHVTFVEDDIEEVSCVGWVIVTEDTDVHKLASLTVTVYVPIDKPVAVDVVCPFDHR